MTKSTVPATITFAEPTVTAVKRGRPELFTPAIQDTLRANPGKFAPIQSGIKSASRVSVLRKNYKDAGFAFLGEPQTDGTLVVFAKYDAPEPEATPEVEAPAQARRVRPSRSKAAIAERARLAAEAAQA